jgi:hypothetical protein
MDSGRGTIGGSEQDRGGGGIATIDRPRLYISMVDGGSW